MEKELELDIDQKEYPLILKLYFGAILISVILLNYFFIRSVVIFGTRSLGGIILDIFRYREINPREEVLNHGYLIASIIGFRFTIGILLVLFYIFISYTVIKRYRNMNEEEINILNLGSTHKLKDGLKNKLGYRRNGIPFYQPLFLVLVMVQSVAGQFTQFIQFTSEGRRISDDVYYILVFQAIISIASIFGLANVSDSIFQQLKRSSEFIDGLIVITPLIFVSTLLIDSKPIWLIISYLVRIAIPVILYLQYRIMKDSIVLYIDDPESINFDRYVKREGDEFERSQSR